MAEVRRKPASATPRLGSLPGFAVVFSILGLVLGSATLFIHYQMAASQGAYTSFCDVSAELSCSVVLGSAYAYFLGIPVAGWSLLAYALAAGLALMLRGAPADRQPPLATALLALSGGILAVSLYFLSVATFVIGVACPFCLTLDATAIALFATAVAMVRTLARGGSIGFQPARPLALAGAAIAVGVVVLGVVQAADQPVSGPLTVERIKELDPKFYAFYISQPVVEPPIAAGDRAKDGKAITIVEFSDFECPHCKRAFADLSSVLRQDGKDVRLIHRNFPLHPDCNPAIPQGGHEYACDAAEAAECAARMGRGHEYQQLLFANQESLTRENLLEYAERLGLDASEFTRCLDSPEATAAVANDVKAGQEAGVESTPTLFINGRRIKGGFGRADQYRYALAIERSRQRSAQAQAQVATP